MLCAWDDACCGNSNIELGGGVGIEKEFGGGIGVDGGR